MKSMMRSILAVPLLAGTGALAPQARVEPVFAGDLPNVPGQRLTAIKVTYAPGQGSLPHHHARNGFLIAYVLRGHIRSQVEGEAERVYAAGESWTEGPGAHHLVSRNASSKEPAEFLVVFVASPDSELSVPDK